MTVRLESANLSKCLGRSRDAVASRPVTMNLLSVIFYTLISGSSARGRSMQHTNC